MILVGEAAGDRIGTEEVIAHSRDILLQAEFVGRALHRLIILEIAEDDEIPTLGLAVGVFAGAIGDDLPFVVAHVERVGDADLHVVAAADHRAGEFASAAERRIKQGEQKQQDGDHNDQLQEGEAGVMVFHDLISFD